MLEEYILSMIPKLIVLALIMSFNVTTDVFTQTRIRLEPGRSSASTAGLMEKGAVRRFVVASKKRHELAGKVVSPSECVRFARESTSLRITTKPDDNWISITNYCNRPSVFTLTVSLN
jgi:hypothetical protein